MKLTLTTELNTIRTGLKTARNTMHQLGVEEITEAELNHAYGAIEKSGEHEFPSGKWTYKPDDICAKGTFELEMEDEAIRIILPMITRIVMIAKPIVAACVGLSGMFTGAKVQFSERKRDIAEAINRRWGRPHLYAVKDVVITDLNIRAAILVDDDGFDNRHITDVHNYSNFEGDIYPILSRFVETSVITGDLEFAYDTKDEAYKAFGELCDSYYKRVSNLNEEINTTDVEDTVGQPESCGDIGTKMGCGICTLDPEDDPDEPEYKD